MSHDPKRRKLLVLGAGAAAVAASAGGPAAVAVLAPGDTVREGGEFLPVIDLEDLAPGKPLRLTLRADRQDAWALFRNVELGAVYLVRQPDDTVQAFSTVCPHLGCAVDHDPDRGVYVCPCHDSDFGPGGEVLSGPSESPLTRLDTRVVDGKVLVKPRGVV